MACARLAYAKSGKPKQSLDPIRSNPLVFLDRFPYEGKALFVRLRDSCPLVGTQFVRTEAGYPHVVLPLKVQLHVAHLDLVRLSVLGEGARRLDGVLDKVVDDLKQKLLNILVQLRGGIHLSDELCERGLVSICNSEES